jgi:type IV secretory pathway TraG/TraD family ATPase VirD4
MLCQYKSKKKVMSAKQEELTQESVKVKKIADNISLYGIINGIESKIVEEKVVVDKEIKPNSKKVYVENAYDEDLGINYYGAFFITVSKGILSNIGASSDAGEYQIFSKFIKQNNNKEFERVNFKVLMTGNWASPKTGEYLGLNPIKELGFMKTVKVFIENASIFSKTKNNKTELFLVTQKITNEDETFRNIEKSIINDKKETLNIDKQLELSTTNKPFYDKFLGKVYKFFENYIFSNSAWCLKIFETSIAQIIAIIWAVVVGLDFLLIKFYKFLFVPNFFISVSISLFVTLLAGFISWFLYISTSIKNRYKYYYFSKPETVAIPSVRDAKDIYGKKNYFKKNKETGLNLASEIRPSFSNLVIIQNKQDIYKNGLKKNSNGTVTIENKSAILYYSDENTTYYIKGTSNNIFVYGHCKVLVNENAITTINAYDKSSIKNLSNFSKIKAFDDSQIYSVSPDFTVNEKGESSGNMYDYYSKLKNKKSPKIDDIAFKIGEYKSEPIYIPNDTHDFFVGKTGTGKGYGSVVNQICKFDGSVVTFSIKDDNTKMCALYRKKHYGPIYNLDAENQFGYENTFKFSPILGCENPVVAKRRAESLVKAGGIGAGENDKVWATTAGGILQAILHACALGNLSIHDCFLATKSASNCTKIVQILEDKSEQNWEKTIETIKAEQSTGGGQTTTSKWLGVENAFAVLDIKEIRDCFDVKQGQQTDLEQFILTRSTLFGHCQDRGSDSSTSNVGGFLSMILTEIYFTAKEINGRLDPPLLFCLDEMANMFYWNNYETIVTAGRGKGIKVSSFFQTISQLEQNYKTAGSTISENSNLFVYGDTLSGEDGEKMAKRYGSFTRKIKGSISKDKGLHLFSKDSVSGRVNESENYQKIPVLESWELTNAPTYKNGNKNGCIWLFDSKKPYLIDLVPWTKRPELFPDVISSMKWFKNNPPLLNSVNGKRQVFM